MTDQSAQHPTPPFLSRFCTTTTAVLAAWYVCLCLIHWIGQRPLWNDEACVFASIRSFTARQMFTEKLLSIQVFPRVTLFLIQRFSRLFDYSLLSLRFLPLLGMLSAFLIWVRLASRDLEDRWDRLTFVLSWPASAMLIYYAAELKQYSMDVLAGALVLMFLVRWGRRPGGRLSGREAVLLLLLPGLGLFSYPAFLFAGIVLYNLILDVRRQRCPGRLLGAYAGSLAFFLAVSYFCDMRFRHVTGVTEGFADYFISFASVGDFFKTFQEGTLNLFVKWLVIRPRIFKKIGTFFMVLGLLYMFTGFFNGIRKDGYRIQSPTTAAFVLYAGLFLLGALKSYPFTVPRISLFFCPFVLLLTVRGIRQLKKIHRALYAPVHAGYVVFLLVLAVGLSQIVLSGRMDFAPVLFGGTG